ncbi:uncharacterized protein LOC143297891 isoform X2 [Babylonia areolata]|uniref:uncharacterized protein LOC143297891 isoform X2 n=1 Tax=Babylonia areolata TaxID=304850 RepID=UPI003FD4EE72
MSLLNALAGAEEQSDQGWRYSNSYNNSNVNNPHPPSSSHGSQQQHASFSMSAAGTGNVGIEPQGVKNSVSENEARLMDEFEGDSEFEGDPEDYDFEGYTENFEDYPEGFDLGHYDDGQGYYGDGGEQFNSGQGHYGDGQIDFEDDQGHFEGGQHLFEDGQEHFEDGQEHYEDGYGPYGDVQGHYVDGQGHYEDGQEHYEEGQEHYEDGQGHYEDGQGHYEDGQGHYEGDQGHYGDGQEHFEGDPRHFGDPGQFEESERQFEVGEGQFEEGEEQFEEGEGQFEEGEGQFEEGEGQFEDGQEHMGDDQPPGESGKSHSESGQGQVKGQRQFEGSQEHFKSGSAQAKGQRQFEGSQEHFKSGSAQAKGQRQFEGSQEHFKSGSAQAKGQRQFEGSQEHFKSGSAQAKGQRQFEGGREHFKSGPSQVKGQWQFEGDEEHFKSGPGQFKGQRQFQSGQDQVKGQQQFEGGQEHVRSGQGQAKGQRQFQGEQEHFKSRSGQVKGQRQFEGGQEQFKSGPGQMKGQRLFGGDQERFKSVQLQGHVRGERHFKGDQQQIKNGQGQSKDQRHYEDSQEHFKSHQGHFEGSQVHFRGGQGHFRSQRHFEAGHEQIQGEPRHFEGDPEDFEAYPDDFDDEDEFFEDDEDFEGDEEDFDFEDEQGNLIQDSRIESSSSFQNSYNKYVMSQYHHTDVQSDYDEQSEDEPDDDMEQEGEDEQLTNQSGTREVPPQKGRQPQPGKSAQQEHQMRLPLRVQDNREFSPAPSQSVEPPEQQNVGQKSAGPHRTQQEEEKRTNQEPPHHSPKHPAGQRHSQQAGKLPILQAKPRQLAAQAASEVTVTSHNVTVSTYNHHPRNSSEVMSQNQRQVPRMPNLRMNSPNQCPYPFPGHGVRYVSQGHRLGQRGRKNWHMPQRVQVSHAHQTERQRVSSGPLRYPSMEQEYRSGRKYGFPSQGSQQPAPKQRPPQHFHRHPQPHPRMQTSAHSFVRGPAQPPRPWPAPRGPSKNIVEHPSQGVVHRPPKVSAQRLPQPSSGKQPSPAFQRQGVPQVMQNMPQTMARNRPPAPSGTFPHQVESGQRGGKPLVRKQKTLRQEMQQFNLPSRQPKVIVQGERQRGNRCLQQNTQFSVQRSAASRGTVLHCGSDGKNYLCPNPDFLQGPVMVRQAQQRLSPSHVNKGCGKGGQDSPVRVHSTSDRQRPEQGGSATATTTNTITTADSTTTYTVADQSSNSPAPTAAGNKAGDQHAVESTNKRMADDDDDDDDEYDAMNGEMDDDDFDSDMVGYDEEFDEDFEDDDEDYYDEEEVLEHDAVMREMEEMGDLSPPRLPVGVARRPSANEGWPTPLPSMNKKTTKVEPEAGGAGVEFVSSSSQRSCSSPVFGFTPNTVAKECTPPSPGPEKDSHLTPLEPVQPSIPPPSDLQEQRGCAKRPLADDEEGTTLCKYCGQCSSNLNSCDVCKRNFPPDIEVFIKKRKTDTPDSVLERERTCGGGKVNPSPSTTNFVLDKKTFYGKKVAAEGGSYSDEEEEMEDNFVIKSTERTFSRLQGNRGNFPNQRKVFRGVKEPVTVTISSDEDEGPSTTDKGQPPSSSKPAAVKPVPVTAVTTITSAAAAAAAASHTKVTAAAQEKDDSFFSSPVAKPTSTFGVSRRSRMEDAAGRCIPNPARSRSPLMRFVGEGIYFNVRGIRIGSMRTSGLEVRFMTRSIAFTVISDRTQEELDFFVYVTDIKSIEFTLKPPQPVAFLHVTPGCGGRLRSHLKMVHDSPEYFDPGSRDPQKNMIVIIIETMTDEAGLREMLRSYSKTLKIDNFLTELDTEDANDILVSSTPPILNNTIRTLPTPNPTPSPSLGGEVPPHHNHPSPSPGNVPDSGDDGERGGEGEEGEGMGEGEEGESAVAMAGDADIYHPPEGYEGYEEYGGEEEDGCPPYYGFVGPVEKLLTYPPAPAKGGIAITNQDLFCLNEGEFLNDVILDFYLKYIFLEKLTEEDRQRTHIFSSFFFKRLTQKQARSAQDQEEVKLTLPERRHSRVRTWTRQVDIFSKDFLLIPINENAHWFLAIVCFPSLAAQEYVSFQPLPLCEPDEPAEQAAEPESKPSPPQPEKEEGLAEGEDNPDSQPDTPASTTTGAATSKQDDWVLGTVIPKEAALQCQQDDFKVGLRQPCILVMDSLMGPSRNSIIKILKEYLQVEWDLKKGTPHDMMTTMRGGCPRVPQQNNFSDCGIYVLQYAESFFDNPIANFALPMKLEGWFPRRQVERKREEIHDLILHLKEQVDSR